MRKHLGLIVLAIIIAFATACSNETSDGKKEEKDKYTALADEKNKEAELAKLEFTDYAEEVGATLSTPKYKEFSVNSSFTIKGEVAKPSDFKSDFVWIQIESEKKDGPTKGEFEYFVPLDDGKFSQKVQLYNGKGKYEVKVSLPSDTSERFYKGLAKFTVHNVNPAVKRDISYNVNASKHDLKLEEPVTGMFEEDGFFKLSGSVDDAETLMVTLQKEDEETKVIVPVDDGKFSKEIPLYSGKGIHKVTIMVPKEPDSNYYHEAAVLLVDNQSSEVYEPIKFSKDYNERGYTLTSPVVGGEESDLTYSIKGTIDSDAPFADKTNVVLVGTKKGDLEAMYSIPVEDYQFDGEVYLRFGPGEYEVTVYAPDYERSSGDYMRYNGLASFNVTNTAEEDKRYLLPSKGIQSDNPKIQSLAKEIIAGKTGEKAKAKAIYEYVAKNISYDVEKLNNESFRFDDSALKTLKEKTGVCQDYAYLAIALLRASDMEARMATGTAVFAFQRHAWVETKVDGEWLTMDPTWGSGYLKDDKFVKEFTMKYFNPDPAEFKDTHNKLDIEY